MGLRPGHHHACFNARWGGPPAGDPTRRECRSTPACLFQCGARHPERRPVVSMRSGGNPRRVVANLVAPPCHFNARGFSSGMSGVPPGAWKFQCAAGGRPPLEWSRTSTTAVRNSFQCFRTCVHLARSVVCFNARSPHLGRRRFNARFNVRSGGKTPAAESPRRHGRRRRVSMRSGGRPPLNPPEVSGSRPGIGFNAITPEVRPLKVSRPRAGLQLPVVSMRSGSLPPLKGGHHRRMVHGVKAQPRVPRRSGHGTQMTSLTLSHFNASLHVHAAA